MVDLTNVSWRKSSRSGDNGGHCVEVAGLPSIVAVRDSKNPHHPALTLSRRAFRTLAANVKDS